MASPLPTADRLSPEADPATGDDDLVAGVLARDRRSLARLITLIESTRPDHRLRAESLLDRLATASANANTIRIGISGVPGVGKSTFIESFGMALIARGHRVAVLAVDPTSRRTGGSILGDKTRMAELSRTQDAFIRPSPSGGVLGGVARRTADAITAVEAGGFDVVLVETVGVGQSETAVADLVDLFLLLLAPAGGDDLQGIKKGVVEIADLLVVNKADGDLLPAATRTVGDYRAALGLLRPAHADWTPKVLSCSAQTHSGVDGVWDTISEFRAIMTANGGLAARRRAQAVDRMWADIGEALMGELRRTPAVREMLPAIERDVASGTLPPGPAARRLIAAFHGMSGGTSGTV